MDVMCVACCFCFKQKTAYEMRISDWSSDVCSSDLQDRGRAQAGLTIDLLNRQTMVRFEPDSVSVDDANDRNGNAEASCCYRGDAIKGTVRRRIENLIAPYCGNALGFVFRNDVHIRVRHGSSLFLVAGELGRAR